AQMDAAHAAGLAPAPDAPPARAEAPAAVTEVREVVREVPVAGPGTVVIDKPLRSGQQVYARGADLVVLAMVSFGAEVIADGNIHVYAPLRGRAIAGARGNTAARIFSTCLEPQLVSIAGNYRTTETELPDNVRGKPAQVRLDGEKLLIEPL
ncbi:MAG: septum site-determining protein MinC, partial [Giesbergeria sp.]